MWTPLQTDRKSLTAELLFWLVRGLSGIVNYFKGAPETIDELRYFLHGNGRAILNIIVDIVRSELESEKNLEKLSEKVILWIIEMGDFQFKEIYEQTIDIPDGLHPRGSIFQCRCNTFRSLGGLKRTGGLTLGAASLGLLNGESMIKILFFKGNGIDGLLILAFPTSTRTVAVNYSK